MAYLSQRREVKPKYTGGKRPKCEKRTRRRDLYVSVGRSLGGHIRLHRVAGWAFGQGRRRVKVGWVDFQTEKESGHLRWVVDHLQGAKTPGAAHGVYWQSLELVSWAENVRRAKARGEL